MSGTTNMTLCILWETELREAARRLKIANELPDNDPNITIAQQQAWGACSVALAHLTDDRIAVLLGADDIRKHAEQNVNFGNATP